MKQLTTTLTCLGLLIASHLSVEAGSDRLALIFGNGEYQMKRLSNLDDPPRDADLIGGVFRQLGFETFVHKNATYPEMRKALLDFRSKVTPDSTIVFYFSGHGIQVKDDLATVEVDNYLLPTDLSAEYDYDVQSQSLSLSNIMRVYEKTQAGTRLFFLDCCRNSGSFLSNGEKGFSKGLAKPGERRNSLVCFATQHGAPALETNSSSPYSLYSKILAEELIKPGVSIQKAHQAVTSRVDQISGGKQTPTTYGTLVDEIYLSGSAPPKVTSHTTTDPATILRMKQLEKQLAEDRKSRDLLMGLVADLQKELKAQKESTGSSPDESQSGRLTRMQELVDQQNQDKKALLSELNSIKDQIDADRYHKTEQDKKRLESEIENLRKTQAMLLAAASTKSVSPAPVTRSPSTYTPSSGSGSSYQIVYRGSEGMSLRSYASRSGSRVGDIFRQSTFAIVGHGETTDSRGGRWAKVSVTGWIPVKGSSNRYLSNIGGDQWKVTWHRPGDNWVSMRTSTGKGNPLVAKAYTGTILTGSERSWSGSVEYLKATITGYVSVRGSSGTTYLVRR